MSFVNSYLFICKYTRLKRNKPMTAVFQFFNIIEYIFRIINTLLYKCVCTCMCLSLNLYTHLCSSVCSCACTCVSKYKLQQHCYTYVCVYVCLRACAYVCLCRGPLYLHLYMMLIFSSNQDSY